MIQVVDKTGYSKQPGTIQILDSSYYGVGEDTADDWITLVTGYKIIPTLLTTIPDGDVYSYTYATNTVDKTYYRLVPSGALDDAFYTTFSLGVLSGMIANKKLTIIN